MAGQTSSLMAIARNDSEFRQCARGRLHPQEIESVPHLEALLLLFNSCPRQWSSEELAKALYVSKEAGQEIAEDLRQRGLLKNDSETYSYNTDSLHNGLIQEVDRTYRRELLRISKMIHAKAPSSVREFARAFRFKKD